MSDMNRLIVVLLAIAVTLPLGIKSRQSRHHAVPAAFSVQSSARTTVRVSGDVLHPGIYHVSANTLTVDAILLAVPSWQVKSSALGDSGALTLCNGADIRVIKNPDKSALITVGMIPVVQRIQLRIPLDMNAMSTADFRRIPGVGPVLAQRITDYRHNNGGMLAPEELTSIEGIGEKKYNQLKRYFK
jgi:competence protein ComEA